MSGPVAGPFLTVATAEVGSWISSFTGLFFVILVKATVVVAVAWYLAFATRRSSAAARDTLWRCAFVVLLLLPFAAVMVPSWGLLPGRQYSTWSPPTIGSELANQSRAPSEVTGGLVAPGPSQPQKLGGPLIPIAIVMLWFLGVTVSLVRLLVGVGRVRRWERDNACVVDPSMQAVLDDARQHFGVRQKVRLVVTERVSVPSHWGFLNPVIALPITFCHRDVGSIVTAVRHEMAHVARGDAWFHLVTEFVRGLYWINPLIALAAKRADVERERACDDATIMSGITPHDYGRELMALAHDNHNRRPIGALCLARRSGLGERMFAIMDRSTNRTGQRRRATMVAIFGALMIALATGAMKLRQSAQVPVAVLIEQLASSDLAVVRHAAWALGEREDRRAVRPLVDLVTTGEPEQRIIAAWALGEIKDPSAIPALATNIEHEDPLVREMVVLALGEIESPAAVDHIISALAFDQSLAESAIWALEEIDHDSARQARATILIATGHVEREHPDVWTGMLGKERAPVEAVSNLMSRLRSPDPAVRRDAAEQLGRGGDEHAVDSLMDLLRDTDPGVRAMAVWALDEISALPPQ